MNKPKRPRDFMQRAKMVVDIATGAITEKPVTDTRNQAAVALGALGASKGGKARAEALTPTKRKKIAKQAANTRWHGGASHAAA